MENKNILAGIAAGIASMGSATAESVELSVSASPNESSPSVLLRQNDLEKNQQGFCFDQESGNAQSPQDFLEDPVHFLEKAGVDFSQISCPEKAHQALTRGYKLAEDLYKRIKEYGLTEEGVKGLNPIVESHLGKSFRSEFIPYGLKFIEEIEGPEDGGFTASVSGTVTFADGDSDVDG